MVIPSIKYSYPGWVADSDDDDEGFNKMVVKLFIKFLKKKKAMTALYSTFKTCGKKYKYHMWSSHTSDLVLDWLRYSSGGGTKPCENVSYEDKLVMCQLWRIYLLEHQSELPHTDFKDVLLGGVKWSIINNGHRNNDEIKQYFAENNIEYK